MFLLGPKCIAHISLEEIQSIFSPGEGETGAIAVLETNTVPLFRTKQLLSDMMSFANIWQIANVLRYWIYAWTLSRTPSHPFVSSSWSKGQGRWDHGNEVFCFEDCWRPRRAGYVMLKIWKCWTTSPSASLFIHHFQPLTSIFMDCSTAASKAIKLKVFLGTPALIFWIYEDIHFLWLVWPCST